MNQNNLLVVLGNQLFPLEYVQETGCDTVFMKEDLGLCTDYKHHKLKILFYLVAMREYRDSLLSAGYSVLYHNLGDNAFRVQHFQVRDVFILEPLGDQSLHEVVNVASAELHTFRYS